MPIRPRRYLKQTFSTTRPTYGQDAKGGSTATAELPVVLSAPCLFTLTGPETIEQYGGDVRSLRGTITAPPGLDVKPDDKATSPTYPNVTFRVVAVRSIGGHGLRLGAWALYDVEGIQG